MLSVADRAIIKEAAKINPGFARKYGLPVRAPSDYQVTGFEIPNYSNNMNPGDTIFVDVAATIFDQNAGIPDAWQVCVAGAQVDSSGKPTDVSAFITGNSREMGRYWYDNVIVLNNQPLGSPLNPHVHLVLGTIQSGSVNIKVELFANHSDSPGWDWSQWQYPNGPEPSNGWDILGTKDISLGVGKGPTNWLLIGGIFLVVAGGFVVWAIRK